MIDFFWENSFPVELKWNAKKRLNKLFIKKLALFPKFGKVVLSGSAPFFYTKSRFIQFQCKS